MPRSIEALEDARNFTHNLPVDFLTAIERRFFEADSSDVVPIAKTLAFLKADFSMTFSSERSYL